MAVYKNKNPTKDGRCWYFKVYKKDFEGNNKAFKSKRYLTKKEAIDEKALFILKRDNPNRKLFTLVAKDYFKELYETKKESTAYSYEVCYNKNILPYFKKYFIDEINVNSINNWKEKMIKKGFKLHYLNKLHNVFKRIFDFAIRNYGLKDNPVTIGERFQIKADDVITDDEKIRYLTLEEFQQFISVIDDILWKTFFIFLFYTGMRKGEVQALTWNDIDFEKNEIIVNKTLSVKVKKKLNNFDKTPNFKVTSTKNNINRKIKMSKTLREQLQEYKKEVKKYTDYNNNWYVFGNSRFIAQTTIDNKKHLYFNLSGVHEITVHEFRHSHVSLLINEYVKSGQTDTVKFFLMMSNRMGHTIGVMQKTYMHLFPTIQNEIVDLLDNL